MHYVSSIIVSSIIVLTACATPSTNMPRVEADELAAEKEIHERMVREAEAQGGVPRTWRARPGMKKQFERVADRIEKAGAQVCREMGLPEEKRRCYYYFALSTDKDINASADGDSVTINYGMMRFLNNDDELAGVMGHELAHNLMDHKGAKTRNATIGAVLGAMIDVAAATQGVNTSGNFTDAGAYGGVVGYSPEFEREADYVGLYIMTRAGYDPRKVVPYWRRLSIALPETASGSVTHPSNPERLVSMQETIEEIQLKRVHKQSLLPNSTER